ncbi:hypothetical protein GCM10028777_05640 [Angustibacter speluncae]
MQQVGAGNRRTYVSGRGLGGLATVLAVVGIAAAVLGPAYAVNAATRAPAAVVVPLQLLPYGPEANSERVLYPAPPVPVVDTDGWPEGVLVRVVDDRLVLSATGSTVAEQLLSRGDVALLGLTVGACALLLLPVLRALADGAPFRDRGSRRLALAAAVVWAYAALAPLLPAWAAAAVVARTGIAHPAAWQVVVDWSFAPFVVGAALLVLAETFRRGERLAHDVEGLV